MNYSSLQRSTIPKSQINIKTALSDIILPFDYAGGWADKLHSNNCYEWSWSIGEFFKPKKYCEIGVRYGYSLFSIIRGSSNIEEVTIYEIDCDPLYSVYTDPNNPSYFNYVDNKLSEHKINHKSFKQDTRIIDKLDIEEYCMIAVDGDHTFDSAFHDLEIAYQALAVGGVLILDDVRPINYGASEVCRAGLEFSKLIDVEPTVIDSDVGIFYWTKPSVPGSSGKIKSD